jgi:hypothetical protein
MDLRPLAVLGANHMVSGYDGYLSPLLRTYLKEEVRTPGARREMDRPGCLSTVRRMAINKLALEISSARRYLRPENYTSNSTIYPVNTYSS